MKLAWSSVKLFTYYFFRIIRYFLVGEYRKNVFSCVVYRLITRLLTPHQRERVLKAIIATGFMRSNFKLMLACLYQGQGRMEDSFQLLLEVIASKKKLRARHFNYPFVRELFAEVLMAKRIRFRALDLFYCELNKDLRDLYVFFITHSNETIYLEGILEQLGDLKNRIFKPMDLIGVDELASQTVKLSPSVDFQFLDPRAFESTSVRSIHTVQLPAQNLWLLENAQVLDGFQVVKNNDFVIYEKSADPRNGFVAGIWQVAEVMKNGEDRVFVDFAFERRVNLDSAVLLSGRCTRNYFHWLIEYMPKMLNVIDSGIPVTGPLLIDSAMPAQHYDIARFVAKKYGFSLLPIEPKTLCAVNKLYVPSPSTFHPDDQSFEYWEGGGVSQKHLHFIRKEAYEYIASLPVKGETPRRVYLRRRSAARRITNEDEVEHLVEKLGFTIIEPAALSFAEQVQVFANADVIMSPAGAALSNVVFMREGATAISILADYNKGYCMKANIANAVGVHFFHITGDLVKPREFFESYDQFRFSEFTMDTAKIERAIQELDRSIRSPSGINPGTSHSLH
jgi:capsular polysaccharide biosynthesis protein